MRSILAAVAAAILVSACAAPFQKFYTPVPGTPADAHTLPGYVPQDGALQIFSTDDINRDARAMRIRGWVPIGSSFFYAPANQIKEAGLRAQASRVGASAVLISNKFKDTVTGAVPLTVPTTATSYTTSTATAYGAGGVVNAYGNATTTTHGTSTTMMPFSVSRNDVGAIFFVRVRSRLGIVARSITDNERQLLQTNSAVAVDFTVEHSNAFLADVFPGDFVMSIGGQAPTGPEDLLRLIKEREGQEVELVLKRGDQTITKHVKIEAL